MPVSSFNVNDTSQCLGANNFIFTNNSTIASGSMNHLWNFGDGDTSTSASPSHSFLTVDTFAVKLVTTSAFGCMDSTLGSIITYPMPVTSFTISDSTQCLSGNSFTFTNTSTIPSGTLSYLWQFGDASSSVLPNPVHSYSTADTFMVQLRVTSGFACKDSLTTPVYVYPMPVAAFSINDSAQCLASNIFVFFKQ